MPRKRPTVPPFRVHKATGQPYVNLAGRRHYLGQHDRPEARMRYARLLAEWTTNGQRLPVPVSEITVVELLARYWDLRCVESLVALGLVQRKRQLRVHAQRLRA